jgi:hypothetical protein
LRLAGRRAAAQIPAMRISDYFGGQRFTFVTRMSPGEVEARINEASGSVYNPFGKGVIGWARWGRLRLRYVRHRFFHYNGQPVLAGQILADRAGSRIELIYRAPLPIYAFMPIWYLLLGFASLMVAVAPAQDGGGWPFFLPFLIGLGALPILFHYAFTMRADDDLQAMFGFLRKEAGADKVAQA